MTPDQEKWLAEWLEKPSPEVKPGECPRNATKAQMVKGLRAGMMLCVDRRDAPELPELMELETKGLVSSILHDIDEQSSVRKFRWVSP